MIGEDWNHGNSEVKCQVNIGGEEKDALLRLNMLRAESAKKVFQFVNLLSALLIFSIAFCTCAVQLPSAWVYLMLSLLFAIVGLSAGKFQKVLFRVIIQKVKDQTNNDQKREYLFSKQGVDISSDLNVTHDDWSSFVGRGEIEHYIYLLRKDHKVVLVDKNELLYEELIVIQNFIEAIEVDRLAAKKQSARDKQTSLGLKLLVAITSITVIVSLGYIGIKTFYPLSEGQIFRLWFARTLPIVLLIILQCLDLTWIFILSKVINSSRRKSLLKRIILWIAGIFVIFVMVLGVIGCALNDDSEHYNGDGTVIVKSPVWLDDPDFYLYQEENFLTLGYLRDADGFEDIDATITQKEYLDNKFGKFEVENNHEGDAEQETAKDNETDQDKQETERNGRIDEGYQKVYEAYLQGPDTVYKKDYDAKGNSYIVIYEDETQIRYLMYDRDDDGRKTARYVCY